MIPVLKTLLRERHLHEFLAFTAEYRRIAREMELPRGAEPPTKATYYHWLSGQLQGLPRGYHCIVLEQMFRGWTATDLFARDEPGGSRGAGGGLLATITPTVEPTRLADLWCTAYIYDGAHHADLTTIGVNNGVVTGKNFPPAPRSEGRHVGFSNDIVCTLSGRHLIGQWRNFSDSYYYGTLHLVVLPGESVLDGYYTSVLTDARVEAGRWRWVRVDPQTVRGVDLSAVTLGDPRRLYDALIEHSDYGSPMALEQVVEH